MDLCPLLFKHDMSIYFRLGAFSSLFLGGDYHNLPFSGSKDLCKGLFMSSVFVIKLNSPGCFFITVLLLLELKLWFVNYFVRSSQKHVCLVG